MAEVRIVESLPEHIPAIVEAIRTEDLAECEAAGAPSVADALHRGIRESTLCWTSLVDGEPATIGGVSAVTLLGDIGIPWMLATTRIDRVPRQVLVEGRRHVGYMLERYSQLSNWVDARNQRAVRWLARLGFRIHEPQPYGPYGMPFHRFTMGVD